MEIIKKGKNIKGRTARLACRWCNAILEVAAEDFETETNQEGRKVYSFDCPECSGHNQFRAYALPDNIFDDLKRLGK